MSELFVTSLADVLPRAVAIAQEAWDGEVGDAAEQAYREQMDRSLAKLGMTLEELDQLDTPRSWLGRLIERAQDWWWERRYARQDPPESERLEAMFAFSIPLLQTQPLEDTPYGYDEVDRMMAAAAAQIAQAITDQTQWTPIAFERPKPDEDAFEFDPRDQVLTLWRHSDGTALVLVDGFDEDPKVTGRTAGMVHLPAGLAALLLR